MTWFEILFIAAAFGLVGGLLDPIGTRLYDRRWQRRREACGRGEHRWQVDEETEGGQRCWCGARQPSL